MENLTLKRGDLVKALGDGNGLTRGGVYTVDATLDGGLGVQTLSGLVELVRPDGTLTDACDAVTLQRCPILTLPRGTQRAKA